MYRPLRTVVLVVTAVLLAGCTSAGSEDVPPGPATSPTATPSEPTSPGADGPGPSAAEERDLPQVTVRSADLDDQPVVEVVAPVGLAVPALGIELPIDPVGVREDGQMEIPPLAERAGWYRFGAAPGDPGTAVVAAHVDSVASAGLGPFARLRELVAGDTTQVTSADGTVRTYEVVDVTVLPKPTVTWTDVFTRGADERLVLVTCGGTFSRDTRSYSDNVIVTAVPVGG